MNKSEFKKLLTNQIDNEAFIGNEFIQSFYYEESMEKRKKKLVNDMINEIYFEQINEINLISKSNQELIEQKEAEELFEIKKIHCDLILEVKEPSPFNFKNFIKKEKTIEITDKLLRNSSEIDWGKTRRKTKASITTIDVKDAALTLFAIGDLIVNDNPNVFLLATAVTNLFTDIVRGFNKKEFLSENELVYIKLFLLNSEFGSKKIHQKDFQYIASKNNDPVLFTDEIYFVNDMNELIKKGIFMHDRETGMCTFTEEIIFYD